ncbi:hypothetical protein KBC79_03445 [Candidatus Woesebacteria bacterium]|nr:hypothetical protein [Candidatus Woesebacteria bacterium]
MEHAPHETLLRPPQKLLFAIISNVHGVWRVNNRFSDLETAIAETQDRVAETHGGEIYLVPDFLVDELQNEVCTEKRPPLFLDQSGDIHFDERVARLNDKDLAERYKRGLRIKKIGGNAGTLDDKNQVYEYIFKERIAQAEAKKAEIPYVVLARSGDSWNHEMDTASLSEALRLASTDPQNYRVVPAFTLLRGQFHNIAEPKFYISENGVIEFDPTALDSIQCFNFIKKYNEAIKDFSLTDQTERINACHHLFQQKCMDYTEVWKTKDHYERFFAVSSVPIWKRELSTDESEWAKWQNAIIEFTRIKSSIDASNYELWRLFRMRKAFEALPEHERKMRLEEREKSRDPNDPHREMVYEVLSYYVRHVHLERIAENTDYETAKKRLNMFLDKYEVDSEAFSKLSDEQVTHILKMKSKRSFFQVFIEIFQGLYESKEQVEGRTSISEVLSIAAAAMAQKINYNGTFYKSSIYHILKKNGWGMNAIRYFLKEGTIGIAVDFASSPYFDNYERDNNNTGTQLTSSSLEELNTLFKSVQDPSHAFDPKDLLKIDSLTIRDLLDTQKDGNLYKVIQINNSSAKDLLQKYRADKLRFILSLSDNFQGDLPKRISTLLEQYSYEGLRALIPDTKDIPSAISWMLTQEMSVSRLRSLLENFSYPELEKLVAQNKNPDVILLQQRFQELCPQMSTEKTLEIVSLSLQKLAGTSFERAIQLGFSSTEIAQYPFLANGPIPPFNKGPNSLPQSDLRTEVPHYDTEIEQIHFLRRINNEHLRRRKYEPAKITYNSKQDQIQYKEKNEQACDQLNNGASFCVVFPSSLASEAELYFDQELYYALGVLEDGSIVPFPVLEAISSQSVKQNLSLESDESISARRLSDYLSKTYGKQFAGLVEADYADVEKRANAIKRAKLTASLRTKYNKQNPGISFEAYLQTLGVRNLR